MFGPQPNKPLGDGGVTVHPTEGGPDTLQGGPDTLPWVVQTPNGGGHNPTRFSSPMGVYNPTRSSSPMVVF